MKVSFFKDVKAKQPHETEITSILSAIKEGKWQDQVQDYRRQLAAVKDKKEVEHIKKQLPIFTTSGTFKERKDDALILHSGLVLLDFDDVENPNEVKEIIKNDKYVYSIFVSCSYTGLAILVKIVPEKHDDIFDVLGEYFFNAYGIPLDTSGRNVSRARFVSYDPFLYINHDSKVFDRTIKKRKEVKPINLVFTSSDFDNIISQINNRGIDICPNYYEWLRCGFALAAEFQENGRDYFHVVSSQSSKYDSKICDKQFNSCLKARGHGVTIGTFFHYCKENGIQLISDETKQITQYAAIAKKSKRNKDSAIETLEKLEGVSPEKAKDIFEKVYNSNVEVKTDLSKVEKLEMFLRSNYTFKRNVITRKIEVDGQEIDTNLLNTIYIKAQKECDEKIGFETIERLIFSDFTEKYNPLIEFFESHKHLKPKGLISKLASCIDSNTGLEQEGSFGVHFVEKFLTKWLVGAISAVHGTHSPLQLILTGQKQGTGKTEFFRRLLPESIRHYYTESKMLNGKDDEILMTQKWFIMDDECSGKSKQEAARMKELASKDIFSVREPYGRANVDLKRLAVLCGTSNSTEVLNDPTGNRRVIPIEVLSQINWNLYNSIDKNELWMEIYHLWASGYEWRILGDDIKELEGLTTQFVQAVTERELFQKYYVFGHRTDIAAHHTTVTDVLVYLQEKSNARLSLKTLGAEIKALGGERVAKKDGKNVVYGYYLIEKERL